MFLFKHFLKRLLFVSFAEDDDFLGAPGSEDEDENVDDLFSDLDDLTDDKGGDKGKKKLSKDDDDGSPDSLKKKKNKDFQELLRQQNEDLKALKQQAKEQQDYIDRLTGKDKEKEAAEKESLERKAWLEDTPNKVREVATNVESKLSERLDAIERKQMLKDVYGKIEKQYDVDLKELSPKILPLLDFYSDDKIKEDPEFVLKMCLKTLGKLKKRSDDLPDFEVGGRSSRASKKAQATEAEAIRNRITGKINNKRPGAVENVFGI